MAAGAIGSFVAWPGVPRRFWIAGALCAVLPDLDAIGRPFHAGDVAWLGGHRAFTHSLLFAVLLATGVTWAAFGRAEWRRHRGRIWLYLMVATISHGVLDAFTGFGGGVEFLSPFSTQRFTALWRPITGIVTDSILFVVLYLFSRAVLYSRRGLQGARASTKAM
jgi:inner membrane protein